MTCSSLNEALYCSRSILLIATFSFLGLHKATCTTAVAPLPRKNNTVHTTPNSVFEYVKLPITSCSS